MEDFIDAEYIIRADSYEGSRPTLGTIKRNPERTYWKEGDQVIEGHLARQFASMRAGIESIYADAGLSGQEVNLLTHLALSYNYPVAVRDLQNLIWGDKKVSSKAPYRLVERAHGKIKATETVPFAITNVPAQGYKYIGPIPQNYIEDFGL